MKVKDLPEVYQRQIRESWNHTFTEKGHKYHAKQTWIDNIRWPSTRQAHHYSQLKLAKLAGLIEGFTWEVPLHIGGGVKHRVDWLIWFKEGVQWAETKGFDYPEGKRKRKQAEALHGITIDVWKGENIQLRPPSHIETARELDRIIR